MLCQKIIETLEARYPGSCAMDWDNVGLLVGRRKKEVHRIYVAVDATDEVIEEAIEAQADMLVTHHPMIFSGMKQITEDDFIGRRVLRLIQNDIAYYAMHTNYDVMGMAELAADMLDLKDRKVLEEVLDGEGIGRVGDLPRSMTLEECANFVKGRFGLPNVKIFGEPEKQVQRAAICPGSGKSEAKPALSMGAEVYITGDIDHHTGIDMADCGMAIIDAGHYGVEHIYIADMEHFLKENCPELRVYTAPVKQPFQVL